MSIPQQIDRTTPVARRIRDMRESATVKLADSVATLRRRGVEVIDFSAGRATEATPQYIGEAAMRAIVSGDTHQTMARGKPEFRTACAQKLARDNNITADPETNIIATMGCKHGLELAALATLDPGDEILIEDPCFVSYQPELEVAGAVPVPVPLRRQNGFRWKRSDLEQAITSRTRAILFCSPHNPTGVVHTLEDLELIGDVAGAHDLTVIVDETYERITWRGRQHTSIASLANMRERTVTLFGFTKSFCMGGWRIGFACAPPHVTEAMTKLQQHLNTCASSIAQVGAREALGRAPTPEVTEMWSDWERRCEYVANELSRAPGISCDVPEGGFYAWIDISKLGEGSVAMANRLLAQYRIAVVPGAAFGPHGEGYLRMTCVRSWPELHVGVPRLKAALT